MERESEFDQDYQVIRKLARMPEDDHRLTHQRMEALLEAFFKHRKSTEEMPHYTPHDMGTRMVNAHLVQAVKEHVPGMTEDDASALHRILGGKRFASTARRREVMDHAADALVMTGEKGNHIMRALLRQIDVLQVEHRKFYDGFHLEELSIPEESGHTSTFLKNHIDKLVGARRHEFVQLLHRCEDKAADQIRDGEG